MRLRDDMGVVIGAWCAFGSIARKSELYSSTSSVITELVSVERGDESVS